MRSVEKLNPDFKSGRLSLARAKLIDSLIMYSEFQEIKVVAVFDAAKSGKCARKEKISRVYIVYAGTIEADDWILRDVKTLKETGSSVLVITSDTYVQTELFALIQDAQEEYSESIKRDRLRQKKYSMPAKHVLPFAVPALKTLKKKLLEKDLSNARNTETSATILSTPDPAATDLNSSNQSNGSLRKEKIPIVKLKKRGYGSVFDPSNGLKRKIS